MHRQPAARPLWSLACASLHDVVVQSRPFGRGGAQCKVEAVRAFDPEEQQQRPVVRRGRGIDEHSLEAVGGQFADAILGWKQLDEAESCIGGQTPLERTRGSKGF